MPILTPLLMAACVGVGQGSGAEAPGETAASVAFGVRDVIMASPDWRGRMLSRLQPVARDGSAAIWVVDEPSLAAFLEIFQANKRNTLTETPPIVVALGEPAMMTNEEKIHYVAHLERISDGPPGEGTQLAFKPEVGEIHDGVRVNLLPTHFKGPDLLARVVVEENRLREIHAVQYSEKVKPAPSADSEVVKASHRVRPWADRAAGGSTLGATFQIPEFDVRRVDHECVVPTDGALIVSLGANHRREGKSKPVYAERLIVITTRTNAGGDSEKP